MRQEPEHFGDQDLTLIYIAKRLKEAQALEALLTQSTIDYLVEPDRYLGGTLFRRELVGAFFYITPEDEEQARRQMSAGGFKPWEPE